MTVETADTSPNNVLAEIVLEKLASNGFLPEGKTKELSAKIGAGKATREDWMLWVDLALAKKSDGQAS